MGTESRIQATPSSGLVHESPQTLNETRTTIIDTLRKQTTTTTTTTTTTLAFTE
jgi:hypothetical protein